MSTPYAVVSSNEPLSTSESTATMFAGSLTSIICTPLSDMLVTMAYVLVSIVNTSTSPGAFIMLKPLLPSVSASNATMFAGSLTSIICTLFSTTAVTIAYVLAPIVNVSTAFAPFSAVNPFSPSVAESFGIIVPLFVGSLTSII